MYKREDVLIIAHRGASSDRPENTLEAFVEAGEQGSDMVELDVRLASDGSLIVHHDAWYHDRRMVWSTPSGSRPGHVPDLEEALDACWTAPSMGVNVEIKNTPGDIGEEGTNDEGVPWSLEVVDATLELLAARRSRGIEQEILVTSFDARTLGRVRELEGPPTGQLLYEAPGREELFESCVREGHIAVNPWDPLVEEGFVSAAHDAGLLVNVWTVDDANRVRELAAMEVDGIITNVPAVARAALGTGSDL